jgi:fatty acid desaturase (delta-4 desaturase)
MAPDADKLRQRKPQIVNDGSTARFEQTETEERISTLKTLKGHELVIDGIIYDISDFAHPGGASINIFGGNDATIQYKMIHPYHNSKHLEKMKRVGTIADYYCE